MVPALEAHGVAKRYRRGLRTHDALRDVCLTVPRGGVFGLLGPNGAGKSTLLRISVSLVRPTAGTVLLFGKPVGPASLRHVGAMIESPRFDPVLTGRETLRWLAKLSGRSRSHSPDILLERVGIAEAGDRQVRTYSLGMKQRLGIAAALLTGPDLVILDEPTNGMDPAGILEIRTLIRDLASDGGTTVLLSSHQLDEVERVCDAVAILARGRIVTSGRIGDLLSKDEVLSIRALRPDIVLSVAGGRAAPAGDDLRIRATQREAPELLAAVCAAGAGLIEAKWIRPDLEALYFSETQDPQDD